MYATAVISGDFPSSHFKDGVNYFKNRITNARTEGFNNVAKLLQKRAFGYRNFGNYRLRLLYASR